MQIPRVQVRPFEAKTLTWWKARRNQIDMDPPYQRRGRLWSPTDKSYLIDSIINGFDIPKIYIADFTFSNSTLNKKRLSYAIIDGKQRFEAIFDFFDGKIVLSPDFVYLDKPSLNLCGLSYKDLLHNHVDIAEIFDTFNLSVMSVVTKDEELINELFVRLNRSKPLTGAEIRNAMAGPVPGVIRELAKHDFFNNCIAFSVSRGQDWNAAAKILMFEYYGKPQETKKKTLDSFVKEAAKDKSRLELAWRRSYASLIDFTSIFLPKDKLLASAGTLPVYYWFIRLIREKEYQRVRDFLVRFEEERRENREREEMGDDPRKLDKKLIEYDNYNRSTNDLISHNGRISILKDRFTQYLERKK